MLPRPVRLHAAAEEHPQRLRRPGGKLGNDGQHGHENKRFQSRHKNHRIEQRDVRRFPAAANRKFLKRADRKCPAANPPPPRSGSIRISTAAFRASRYCFPRFPSHSFTPSAPPVPDTPAQIVRMRPVLPGGFWRSSGNAIEVRASGNSRRPVDEQSVPQLRIFNRQPEANRTAC